MKTFIGKMRLFAHRALYECKNRPHEIWRDRQLSDIDELKRRIYEIHFLFAEIWSEHLKIQIHYIILRLKRSQVKSAHFDQSHQKTQKLLAIKDERDSRRFTSSTKWPKNVDQQQQRKELCEWIGWSVEESLCWYFWSQAMIFSLLFFPAIFIATSKLIAQVSMKCACC